MSFIRRYKKGGKTDLNLILKLNELTEKRLVNSLDSIETFDLMNVQQKIFNNVKNAFNLTSSGVVYDVTNTYFHGKMCKIAKFGHDKEKRKGFPLVQIGLAVTQEHGIPIFHKTFPGNINDARTFIDVSNDLMKFGITRGIAVIDRGISSSKNTRFLREEKWKVLCGLKNIIKAYFDKDVVEKAFQSLKGVIRLRPIRHWPYNRVEAHVFICYLACLLLSILKNRVNDLDMSFQKALDELDGLYRVYLKDPRTGYKLGRLVALTKNQEQILRAVDKSLLKECSE